MRMKGDAGHIFDCMARSACGFESVTVREDEKTVPASQTRDPCDARLKRCRRPQNLFCASSLQAQENDVAVYVLGRNAGEGADRVMKDDFELNNTERELLQNLSSAYHALGKKLVVVLNIGGVIETASWKHLVDAIVLPWSPGQEGAHAVVDVLTGNVNPSGKLPMTFAMRYMDIPSSKHFPYGQNTSGRRGERKNVDFTDYEEDIWVGYRYFQTNNVEVSYPFGYGISYTTFSYSKPKVKADKDGFTATITVTNTGKVAGREVVELYVATPSGGLDKPSREL
ncbi:MAG: glycoside hydrolase family 3 C-terminal domain-containing protein, partial [Clostridia bacterium]|nr:glycoside hydrolase family 3 C-terminal domain-containing protein [Clostridia bacterium]